MENKILNLSLSDFEQDGLYLIFSDNSKLLLTRESIEKTVEAFWSDPSKITPQVKKATDFQRCSFCPLKGQNDICDAIRPTIPFLDIVDKYVSFDEVIAVFKESNGLLHISNTTMQEALKYVSILSLMYFCQKGKVYWRYFYGINPLANPGEIAGKLYLNLFFINNGDKTKINSIISKLNEEITIASKNQVMRMNLICKNDAFMNSFVSTQVASMLLLMDMDKKLEVSIKKFTESRKKNTII